MNPAFTSLTGYTLAEAVGKNPRELVKSGRHEQAIYEQLWKKILAGHVWRGELVNRRKDGSLYTERQTITPVHDAGGEITHFIAIKQDLTEQKRAEAALHSVEEKFRSLVEQSLFGIYVIQGDRFIYVNPKFSQIFGYEEDEIYAIKSTGELVSDEDRARVTKNIQIRLSGEVPMIQYPFRARRKDGTFIEVEVYGNRAVLNGQPAVIGALLDVTERKRTEEKLAETEAKLRALFDGSGYAMGLAKDGIQVLVNPAYLKLFGYSSASEVIGSPLLRDIAPDERPRVQELGRRRMLGEAVPPSYETRGMRKDGTAFDMAVHVSTYKLNGEAYIVGILRDVTERKLAESALKVSEQEFRALAGGIPQIVWMTRPDGWNTYFNRQWVEYTGLTLEESCGDGWIKPFHPDDRRRAWDAWKLATQRLDTYALECRLRRFDGAYRWWLIRGVPLLNAGGEVIKWFGTCTDIHDLKLADEKIRKLNDELEQRVRERTTDLHNRMAELQAIFDTAPIGLAISDDPEVRRMRGNPALERIYQMPRGAEFSVKAQVPVPFRIFADGREIDADDLPMQRASRGEVVTGQLVDVVLADGSTVSLYCNCAPLFDERGMPRGAVGGFLDVTESKRAERELRRLTAELRTESRETHRLLREQAELLDRATEAIVVADLAHRITFWNHGAEMLLGSTAAEMLGRPIGEILSLGGAGTGIHRAIAAVQDWQGELHGLNRQGRALTIETRITVIRDDDGRPTARLFISSDVTERKQMEEQALRAQRLENLGTLAAGIAHDFNNALAPIIMAGPMLEKMVNEPAAQRMIKIVEASSARGAALVRQMLSFARGTSGDKLITQVSHVLREVLDLAKSTFPKSIQVEAFLPNDLWPVLSDPTQMHQVFLNLCVNARDAMAGGGELTITAENRVLNGPGAARIEGGRAGSFLAVEVRDTGTGIPPDVLERIFEPFFTTKAEGTGTGLGLSTVRGIVRQHGGFIAVDTSVGNASGHGTTFTVYLPPAAGEAIVASKGPGGPPQRGRGELILFVDDEEPVREIGAKILKQHGYGVISAVDGADAIVAFIPRASEVRLLVSDLDMPRVGGYELAMALREMNSGLPVIVMSGAVNQDEERLKKFAAGFLPKPFEAQTLLELVRRTLDRAGSVSPFQSKT